LCGIEGAIGSAHLAPDPALREIRFSKDAAGDRNDSLHMKQLSEPIAFNLDFTREEQTNFRS